MERPLHFDSIFISQLAEEKLIYLPCHCFLFCILSISLALFVHTPPVSHREPSFIHMSRKDAIFEDVMGHKYFLGGLRRYKITENSLYLFMHCPP